MFSLYKFTIVLFAITALALTPSAGSQPLIGDCNSDGYVNMSDYVHIVNYLYMDGPVPADECDCDGFPGINRADALQIRASIFKGADLYAPPGTDLPVPSHIKIFCNRQIDGSPGNNSIPIYIDIPDDNQISEFMLDFSYVAEGIQAELNCDSISFEESVIPDVYAGFDNASKIVSLYRDPGDVITPPIPGGTSGLVCTAWFTQIISGDENDLILLCNERPLWPMILQKEYYEGVDGERVLIPEFIRAPYGDSNSDGTVNISDAVWIINYVFLGGSPPGDLEP